MLSLDTTARYPSTLLLTTPSLQLSENDFLLNGRDFRRKKLGITIETVPKQV